MVDINIHIDNHKYNMFNATGLKRLGFHFIMTKLLAQKQKRTYKLWVGENLAGTEGVFLGRLVWVFMGDLAEAGHAAGQLTLLQGQQVTLV